MFCLMLLTDALVSKHQSSLRTRRKSRQYKRALILYFLSLLRQTIWNLYFGAPSQAHLGALNLRHHFKPSVYKPHPVL